jgi:hypothetical protein
MKKEVKITYPVKDGKSKFQCAFCGKENEVVIEDKFSNFQCSCRDDKPHMHLENGSKDYGELVNQPYEDDPRKKLADTIVNKLCDSLAKASKPLFQVNQLREEWLNECIKPEIINKPYAIANWWLERCVPKAVNQRCNRDNCHCSCHYGIGGLHNENECGGVNQQKESMRNQFYKEFAHYFGSNPNHEAVEIADWWLSSHVSKERIEETSKKLIGKRNEWGEAVELAFDDGVETFKNELLSEI